MELRDKINRVIRDKVRAHQWTQGLFELQCVDEAADAILAIPEIREALGCLSGGSRIWEEKQGLTHTPPKNT